MAANDESAKVDEWLREAAKLPIEWTGDLHDDCTARWAGLMLRAEQMQRGVWWWAVYDGRSGATLGDSNTAGGRVPNGKKARRRTRGQAVARLRRCCLRRSGGKHGFRKRAASTAIGNLMHASIWHPETDCPAEARPTWPR